MTNYRLRSTPGLTVITHSRTNIVLIFQKCPIKTMDLEVQFYNVTEIVHQNTFKELIAIFVRFMKK
jgi:hypothetical protein